MKLIRKVERVRANLVELGMEKGLQDPAVIKLSQALDRLINKMYKSDPRINTGRTKMAKIQ